MSLRNQKPIEETFRLLREILHREVRPPRYQSLFDIAFTQCVEKESRAGFFPSVDAPFRIHESLRRPPEEGRPLWAACTAIHVAADILDDIADGDLSSCWGGADPNQIILVALDLMGYVKDQALDKLSECGIDSETTNQIRRILSEGIHRMSEGQYRDLTFKPGEGISLADVEEIVQNKSGAQLEMFSCAAAVLGGATEAQADDFALFGRYLAMAGQIVNDCHDIWGKEKSSDLRNGRLTTPVAYALNHSGDAAFLYEALMKAQTTSDPNLLVKIKQELVQRGALIYVAMKASSYKYKALYHLERAAGKEAIEAFADILKGVGLLEESGDDLMCRRSRENECLIQYEGR
jgi:geranylgeranyl pyrophosphate synthase